jgi:hypothetical protein
MGLPLPPFAVTPTHRERSVAVAIYHCNIQIISRGKAQSAIAAAAYRAGEKIVSEYDGRTSDYTRKKGIVHTEILLPDNAPAEYKDRAVLWNAVERVEKAKNSQLAREIEISLPVELTESENLSLVREYVKKNFVEHGMCADIAIHSADSKDENGNKIIGGNPHAHIMLTMRPFNKDKTWGDKQKKVYNLDKDGNKIYDPKKRQYKCSKIQTTDRNEQTKAEDWRESWADIQNQHLEKHGFDVRVDHRSFERQGIDQIPTIHLGVAAHQMEQRGIRTERGDINRAIKFANQKLRNLKAQIVELKNDIAALLVMEKESQADRQTQPQEIPTPQTETPPPGIAPTATTAQQKSTAQQSPITAPPPKPTELNILELLKSMLSNPEAKSKVQRITSLSVVKSAALFLEKYNITTLSKLQKTVANTETKFDEVNEKTKAIEERLKKLNPLIKQADLYMQYRDINKLYKQEKPKHKDRFYESHRMELTLYEAAERFLKANFDGKTLNTKAWKKEAAELTAEKDKLYQEYRGLKEGVRQIGVVRRSVEHILDIAEKMEQPQQQRRHDMER